MSQPPDELGLLLAVGLGVFAWLACWLGLHGSGR